jgi:hypothetical protein
MMQTSIHIQGDVFRRWPWVAPFIFRRFDDVLPQEFFKEFVWSLSASAQRLVKLVLLGHKLDLFSGARRIFGMISSLQREPEACFKALFPFAALSVKFLDQCWQLPTGYFEDKDTIEECPLISASSLESASGRSAWSVVGHR